MLKNDLSEVKKILVENDDFFFSIVSAIASNDRHFSKIRQKSKNEFRDAWFVSYACQMTEVYVNECLIV